MENIRFKYLIISDKHKWVIEGIITVCSSNTLKPKALPRRARGRTGQSPVPSCLIRSNKCCTNTALFRMNAELLTGGVNNKQASVTCTILLKSEKAESFLDFLCFILVFWLRVFLFKILIGLKIHVRMHKFPNIRSTVIGLMTYHKKG